MTTNPLTKYFRQPGIYVSLPSGGHYTDMDIEYTANGEVPVLPMTAADELILKNPDSLLNGAALKHLIESCCPVIPDANQLPIVDSDTIILASKLASSGPELTVNSVCPKCNQLNSYVFDINYILSLSQPLPEEKVVKLQNDTMLVYLKPHSFVDHTRNNIITFEETKIIQNLMNESTNEEEKIKAVTDSFERIALLNLDILSNCIMRIVVPEGAVEDRNWIREFVRNTSKKEIDLIKQAVSELNEMGLPKKLPVVCEKQIDDEEKPEIHGTDCKHEWQADLIYDPSSFFG